MKDHIMTGGDPIPISKTISELNNRVLIFNNTDKNDIEDYYK